MTDEKNRQPNIEVVDIDSLVADEQISTVEPTRASSSSPGRSRSMAQV